VGLVLPLRRLSPEPEREPDPPPVPRTLHLDGTPLLDAWAQRVRDAAEAMLLVDASGRLVALSTTAGELLSLDPTASAGAMLLDLVEVVDFTAGAVPVPDPDVPLPPLRAIVTGRLNRGLVRLRSRGGLHSYDVVGIPLSDSAGAVGFLAPV
jgi:hypothetical protein